MTSDKQGKRWSLRRIFSFSIAFIVIVFGFLLLDARRKNEYDHAQTFKRIAAMKIIQARYTPSPELLKIGHAPQDPCALWAVTDLQAPDKENPYGTWKVRCEVQSKSGSATPTVTAQWIVDSFLADTPDAAAQKLFIRNPQ